MELSPEELEAFTGLFSTRRPGVSLFLLIGRGDNSQKFKNFFKIFLVLIKVIVRSFSNQP